jgi:hypothetical protein
MYTQVDMRKRKLSELFAIAAFAILLIDTADTIVAQGRFGFLHLSDQQRGIAVVIPSVILFFISFAFGLKEKTRVTTSLLITGGALLAVFKLVAPTMGLDLYLAIILRNLYIALIAMGFILMGLGLLRVIRKQ